MINNIINDYKKGRDITKYSKQEIINLIKKEKLPFPYMKYRYTYEQVESMFNDLQNYTAVYKNIPYQIINLKNNNFFKKKENMYYKKKYVLMVKNSKDYLKYGLLSDYFNEECRIKCKRYDEKYSPYELWIKYPDKIIKTCINKFNKIDLLSLRETIYLTSKECTSFRPTIIVSIINLFNSKYILDFSSGWGDRLIGALASKVISYCGVDPNPCLHPNYNKIINKFNKDTNVKLIQAPFQTAKIPNAPYDLVFTSPPYFILEKYTDHIDQSIEKYKNLDDWFNNFLMVSLDKAWLYLQVEGHMVIIINNIKNYPDFIQRMIEEKNKIDIRETSSKSEYLGVISYADEIKENVFKSPQPMWIWKKVHFESKKYYPISLGYDCYTRFCMEQMIRGFSCSVFDMSFTFDIMDIYRSIKNKFNDYFDILELDEHNALFDYGDFLNNNNNNNYPESNKNEIISVHKKYKSIVELHYNSIKFKEDRDKINRRINRFMKLINNNKKILFFRIIYEWNELDKINNVRNIEKKYYKMNDLEYQLNLHKKFIDKMMNLYKNFKFVVIFLKNKIDKNELIKYKNLNFHIIKTKEYKKVGSKWRDKRYYHINIKNIMEHYLIYL